MDREAELRRLEQANRHVAKAKANVDEQRDQLQRFRRDGYDVELAERGLKAFEASLATLQQHREIIIKTIGQIDRGLA